MCRQRKPSCQGRLFLNHRCSAPYCDWVMYWSDQQFNKTEILLRISSRHRSLFSASLIWPLYDPSGGYYLAYLPSHVSMPQHQSRSLQIRVSCKLNHCHSASPQTKRPNDLHDLLGAPAKQQGSAYAIKDAGGKWTRVAACCFLDSRVNPLRLCFLDYSFLCQPSFS